MENFVVYILLLIRAALLLVRGRAVYILTTAKSYSWWDLFFFIVFIHYPIIVLNFFFGEIEVENFALFLELYFNG